MKWFARQKSAIFIAHEVMNAKHIPLRHLSDMFTHILSQDTGLFSKLKHFIGNMSWELSVLPVAQPLRAHFVKLRAFKILLLLPDVKI